MIMSFFEMLSMALRYIAHIVNISITTITTLPNWIKIFALITILISVIYFVLGRESGKSG